MARFEYVPEMRVHSLQPSVGEAAGGGAVKVHGAAFLLHGMHCAFGHASVVVRAEVISSSLLTCIAPASAAGDVSVEVSANNGTDSTHDGVVYRYLPQCDVVSMQPSFGPEAGGTVVSVSGRGFVLN